MEASCGCLHCPNNHRFPIESGRCTFCGTPGVSSVNVKYGSNIHDTLPSPKKVLLKPKSKRIPLTLGDLFEAGKFPNVEDIQIKFITKADFEKKLQETTTPPPSESQKEIQTEIKAEPLETDLKLSKSVDPIRANPAENIEAEASAIKAVEEIFNREENKVGPNQPVSRLMPAGTGAHLNPFLKPKYDFVAVGYSIGTREKGRYYEYTKN